MIGIWLMLWRRWHFLPPTNYRDCKSYVMRLRRRLTHRTTSAQFSITQTYKMGEILIFIIFKSLSIIYFIILKIFYNHFFFLFFQVSKDDGFFLVRYILYCKYEDLLFGSWFFIVLVLKHSSFYPVTFFFLRILQNLQIYAHIVNDP